MIVVEDDVLWKSGKRRKSRKGSKEQLDMNPNQ